MKYVKLRIKNENRKTINSQKTGRYNKGNETKMKIHVELQTDRNFKS